jgi:hypothetical protein
MRSIVRCGLWAALSLASCSREVARRASGDECLFNGDCADPLVCAARRCRAPCRDDRDCANAWLCRPAVRATCAKPPCAPPLRRVCVEPGAAPLCFSDGDCEPEQLCGADNACRYRCAAGFDLDCAARFGAGSTCAVMGGASVCVVDAGAPDATAGAPDAALDATGDRAADAREAAVDAGDVGARDADAAEAPAVALGCATVRRAGQCLPGEAGCEVTKLVHAGNNACVRTSDGAVRCWGANGQQQFGAMTRGCAVPGLTHAGAWRDVAVGADHLCLVGDDGRVRCTGWNTSGQCGTGATTPPQVTAPTPVVRADGSPLEDARAIAAGPYHTCAIVGADGRVACWGGGGNGELGAGAVVTARPSAVEVSGLTGAVGLALALGTSCAWRADGASWCWGQWIRRADGTATMTPLATPQRTLFPPVQRLAVGNVTTCALLRDGMVQCAGSNAFGGLGDGTTVTASTSTPRAVPGLTDVVQLGAAHNANCALRRTGAVSCWGMWYPNFVAGPRMVANPSPVEVAFPTGARDLAMGGSSIGFTSGYIALCGLYGGADVRCLGVYPGEGSTETAYPLRINWTGAGL